MGVLLFDKSAKKDDLSMNEDLLDYLVRMMRPLFPMNACFVSGISGDDYIVKIDWKLENDLDHQNKRSRKIRIKISENAIQDYLDHKEERELYDSRLRNLISQRYNFFDPSNDTDTTRFIPTEDWLISNDLLNA